MKWLKKMSAVAAVAALVLLPGAASAISCKCCVGCLLFVGDGSILNPICDATCIYCIIWGS
jgi:hypothetical protein